MRATLKESFSSDIRYLNEFYTQVEETVISKYPELSPLVIQKEVKNLRDRHAGRLRKVYLRKLKKE